ncbi:MAG: hypothetical protein ACP5N2_04530 [Candidatus Nanoarchaeia archaeon]
MSLDQDIQGTIINNIKGFSINEANLDELDNYARENHDVLKALAPFLNETLIEGAFIVPVLREAKSDYALLIGEDDLKKYADHVLSPSYFAYALETGLFSKENMAAINFDHGQTTKTYIERFRNENLFKQLRERLFNPDVRTKSQDYKPRHASCHDLGHGC